VLDKKTKKRLAMLQLSSSEFIAKPNTASLFFQVHAFLHTIVLAAILTKVRGPVNQWEREFFQSIRFGGGWADWIVVGRL
jgi:hypothetical protein